MAPVTLELGGKSPLGVFPDVDVETVVAAAAAYVYYSTSEVCDALSRAIVHKDIHDEFVDRLAPRAGSYTLGNPSSTMPDETHCSDVIANPGDAIQILNHVSPLVSINISSTVLLNMLRTNTGFRLVVSITEKIERKLGNTRSYLYAYTYTIGECLYIRLFFCFCLGVVPRVPRSCYAALGNHSVVSSASGPMVSIRSVISFGNSDSQSPPLLTKQFFRCCSGTPRQTCATRTD
ncbi:aldehyde dehydrogenase family protein (plasmid) [Haloarcula sp. KBTZ06]|uniref:aldehyde dehydrogenase family protein n=1 Tax=Haloarcula sp. KBTZ06 TaxID=3402682 RepID=UPI003B435E48